MKKQRVFIRILFFLGLFIAIGVGWAIGHYFSQNTQNASALGAQPYELIATPHNLQYLGMTFTQEDPSTQKNIGSITREQAVSAGLKEEPGLTSATSYSTRLGVLTGANIPALAQGRLVWMITYQGIEDISSGPPEAERHVSHEYTVVIDAKTGKYVLAFPLFDVTPIPRSNSTTLVP